MTYQDNPEGIAQAFLIGDNFIGEDNVTLILGDNIYEADFSASIREFESGAKIFCKEVSDAQRFGVVEFDEQKKVISVEEKPSNPKSNFAQTGLYVCDNSVIEKVRNLAPSARGELEITEIMANYLSEGNLKAEFVKGAWFDCGTHDSLLEASNYMQQKKHE